MRLLLSTVCAVLLASLLRTSSARAAPPSDEDALVASRLERRDLAPHELWGEGADHHSLWVAVLGQASRGSKDAWGAFLLVNVPFERFAARGHLGRGHVVADDAPPSLKPAPRPPKNAPAPMPPEPKLDPVLTVDAPPPVPVVVTPSVARRAVKAALRAAHLDAPDAALDRLAARARSSALLPELRLRTMRVVDEAQNLVPTEYDPSRTTASGGASLWLEARATWRLDRLVFADDEVAIERLRDERAELQRKLAARVLEALFAWQRAIAAEADPRASADEHVQATLKVIEAEAMLDVLTDGWFTRWRGRPT